MMPLGQQLERAERLEVLAGELYRLLAKMLPARSVAQNVFLNIAKDEDEHAKSVRKMRAKLKGREHESLRPMIDFETLDRLVEEGEGLKKMLAATHVQVTLEEAKGFMVEQERHFGETHGKIENPELPEVATMFEELAEEDRKHCEMLKALVLP